MKLSAIIILLTLLLFRVAAQDNTTRANPFNLDEKTYRLLPKEAAQPLTLPFANIKVVDARFDTSKIGFVLNQMLLIKRLNLENGFASNLENYLQSSTTLNATDSFSLLVVVKKFWISSFGRYKDQYFKTTVPDLFMRLHAKWEFYIFKGDEYLPFRRIDTLIENDQAVSKLFNNEKNKIAGEENIYSIFRHFLSQFNYSGAIKVFNERNKKSMSDIIGANEMRLNIAVLQEPKIERGVYLSFEEFKNNRPSIKEFKENTVKTGISRQDKYLTDASGTLISKYFVYNNGENTMAGGNIGEVVYRNGNSFEFFLRTRVATPRAQGDIVTGNQSTYRIPYQIDLEAGEIY